MKRGTDIFTWHKDGWLACREQPEEYKGGNNTKRGWAAGYFYIAEEKSDEPSFVRMRDRDEGPTPDGWSVCDDCLYQSGEFRGVIADYEIITTSDETKVLKVVIEDPTYMGGTTL